MRLACFVWICLLAHHLCVGQNQLVVIKNDDVMVRYIKGDDLVYKRKNGTKHSGFIVSINDSTIITSNDTVATHQIERVYFKKGNLMNLMGGFLVVGGAGIFIIDQINTIIVQGEKPSMDDNVTQISLTALAIGLPMMLIKKRSHRVGFHLRLRIINEESPFYYGRARVNPR